jgi:hypothetical protein
MKFLKYKQMQGLEDYLLQVLDVYRRSQLKTDTAIQRKVLCTWIVELQLTKINEYKATNVAHVKEQSKMTDDEKLIYNTQMESHLIQLESMEKEFHQFLLKNKDDLDQDTVMQLL